MAQAEADLAAALYKELMEFRAAAERRGVKVGGCEVGVVTPYKQQKTCLRDTFLRAAGPEASAKARPLLTVNFSSLFDPWVDASLVVLSASAFAERGSCSLRSGGRGSL